MRLASLLAASGLTQVHAFVALIALSSFGIRQLRPGGFSFVHAVSLATLAARPMAVLQVFGALEHGAAACG